MNRLEAIKSLAASQGGLLYDSQIGRLASDATPEDYDAIVAFLNQIRTVDDLTPEMDPDVDLTPYALPEWKTHPLRLRGPRPSNCCGMPTLLVQSKERGYVTADC